MELVASFRRAVTRLDQPTHALESSGPSGPHRTNFESVIGQYTQHHNTSTFDNRSNMTPAKGLTIGAAAIRRRELT